MDHPDDDELEISVFGPGTGESIVLHLGGRSWVIVDSCRNPKTRRPVAVEYLQSLDVDCATQVGLILATHWDSDHIRGIGDVAKSCPGVPIWSSAAVDHVEFDALLSLEEREPGSTAGRLREMLLLRQALGGGHRIGVEWVRSRTMVFSLPAGAGLPRRELWALSPSGRSVSAMLQRLQHVLHDGDPKDLPTAVRKMSRNDTSVALLLRIGDDRAVLLGADLEHTESTDAGWLDAVAFGRELEVQADLVKVPHHGSEDGHCDDMWELLLDKQPKGALTPFNSSSVPKDTDLDRIRGLTSATYITCDGGHDEPVPLLEELESAEGVSLRRLEGALGHVRWRRKIDPNATWAVALDGRACSI